jgi:hypothetical protein
MKKINGIIIVLAVWAPLMAWAGVDLTQWEYRKEINADTTSGYVLLDLDQDVFGHSRNSLSDMRIVNQKGEEVPYTVFSKKATTEVASLLARVFDKSFLPGKSTVFTLDLGRGGEFHNQITIHTASENFRRIVEIEGSSDGASWRYLTTRGQIYDYTVRGDIKPVSIQDTSVTYPDSTVRFLRVTIRDNGEEPLSIINAAVMRRISTRAEETILHPLLTQKENRELHSTDIIADIGAVGIPTYRSRVGISDVNFNRQVDIYSSNNGSDWRFRGSGYLFRVSTPRFQGENTEIQYPEVQDRYIKFSIINKDDKPLVISGVEMSGIVRELAFQIEPGNTYSLYYGNGSARRPEYDIEKLFPYLDEEMLNFVSLAKEEKNPNFRPPEPPRVPLTERNPYVLPVALGIVVAIMAFLLLRLFVKVNPESLNKL